MVNSLGEIFARFFSTDVCSAFNSEALLELPGFQRRNSLEDRLKERPQLHDYESLGISYRYEEDKLLGFIVMQFSDANQARADFEAHRLLATEGLTHRVPTQDEFTLLVLNASRVISYPTPVSTML